MKILAMKKSLVHNMTMTVDKLLHQVIASHNPQAVLTDNIELPDLMAVQVCSQSFQTFAQYNQ